MANKRLIEPMSENVLQNARKTLLEQVKRQYPNASRQQLKQMVYDAVREAAKNNAR